MAGGRKRILIWASAGGVAAIGLLFYLFRASEPVQRTVLPDGTVISFEGLDTAKARVNVIGTRWQRFVLRSFPERVGRSMGIKARVFIHTNDFAAAMALVKIMATTYLDPGPRATLTSQMRANPDVPTGMLITDDVGNEFDVMNNFGSRWASNVWESSFPVPLVSHLAKEYRMRLYFYEPGKPTNFLADFTCSHPIRGAKRPWPAATLPQTNHAGHLTMILERLTPLPTATKLSSGEGNLTFETLARYRIIENGNISHDWYVSSVTVLDEDGNRHPWFSQDQRIGWAETEYRIPGHFSPLETRKFKFKLSGPRGWASQEVEFLARPEGGPIKN
jgi:hypothetical protein